MSLILILLLYNSKQECPSDLTVRGHLEKTSASRDPMTFAETSPLKFCKPNSQIAAPQQQVINLVNALVTAIQKFLANDRKGPVAPARSSVYRILLGNVKFLSLNANCNKWKISVFNN